MLSHSPRLSTVLKLILTILFVFSGVLGTTAYAATQPLNLIPNAINPGDTRTFFAGATANSTSGAIACYVLTPSGIGTTFADLRASAGDGTGWTVSQAAGVITVVAPSGHSAAIGDTLRMTVSGTGDAGGSGTVKWNAISYTNSACTTGATSWDTTMQFQSNNNNTFTGSISPSSITPSTPKQYTIRLTDTATSSGQNIGSARIGIPAGFTSVSVVSIAPHPTGAGSSSSTWTSTITNGYIEIDYGSGSGNQLVSGGVGYVDVTYNATASADVARVTWSAETWNGHAGSGTQSVIAGAEMSTQVDNDLSITKSHSGTWTQGDTNRSYTISVKNESTTQASVGTVTVTETLPSGLTATAISGTGWTCSLGTLVCTTNASVAAGAYFNPISLTVNISGGPASSVTNHVAVSGVHSPNYSDDVTSITAAPKNTATTAANQTATYSSSAQNVPMSATVVTSPAAGTVTSGQVDFVIFNGGTQIGSGVTGTVSNGSASATFSLPAGTAPGTYSIFASYSSSGSFISSSDNTKTLVVNKANQTISFSSLSGKTWGDADFDVSASASSGLSVTFTADGNCTISGATVHITGAGSCTITAHQAGNANYNAATDVAQSFSVSKATASISATGGNFTYDGNAHSGSASATGIGGANLTPVTVTYTGTGSPSDAPVNAGSYTVVAHFAGDSNYNAADSASAAIEIAKATPTMSATGGNFTYDGNAHGGSGSALDINGGNLAFSLVYTGTGDANTAPVNAGDYTVKAHFDGNSNYSAADSAPANIHIAKATASISVSAGDAAYNGSAYTGASCSSNAPGAALSFSPATAINAGAYQAICSVPESDNYNAASSSANFNITKIDPAITVSAADAVYTGSLYGGATTCSSNAPNATLTFSPESPINVGEYQAICSVAESTNYNAGSKSATFHITKSDSTSSVSANGGPYNANPYAAAGTCDFGTLTYSYTGTGSTVYGASSVAPTNAGTYSVTANCSGDANHNGSSSTTSFEIAKTDSSVNVTANGGTFNGSAYAAAGTCDFGSLTYSYTGTGSTSYGPTSVAPVNVGTYSVSATCSGDANHNSSSTSKDFEIKKANSSVSVTANGGVYNGSAYAATGSCDVGSLSLTYVGTGSTSYGPSSSAPVAAGTFSVTADCSGDSNHNSSSTTKAFSISRKSLTVVTNNKSKMYGNNNPALDGSVNGAVDADEITAGFSTAAVQFSNVGGYAINANLNDPHGKLSNYNVSNPGGTLAINKANQVIAWNNPNDLAYGSQLTNGQLNANVAGVAGGSAPGNLSYNPGMGTVLHAGTYTLTANAAETENYNPASKNVTLNVLPGAAKVTYIGQTLWITSGASQTTTQVTLSASIEGPTLAFGSINNATVDFWDVTPGRTPQLLKGSVPVAIVNGATNTGTANAIVTFSTGQYGLESYLIEVRAGRDYTNAQQLPPVALPGSTPYEAAHPTLSVMLPSVSKTIRGSGTISPLAASAGTIGTDIQGDVHFSASIEYTKNYTNPKGQIMIWYNRVENGVTYTYYIKSNAMSSVNGTNASAGNPGTATIYTKASIFKVAADGSSVGLDGNVSLRIDVLDGKYAQSPAVASQIAITALSSKNSALWYSNNWIYNTKPAGYATVGQPLNPNVGVGIEIR